MRAPLPSTSSVLGTRTYFGEPRKVSGCTARGCDLRICAHILSFGPSVLLPGDLHRLSVCDQGTGEGSETGPHHFVVQHDPDGC